MKTTPHQLFESMFAAAVHSAQAEHCLPAHMPEPPKGRTVVIGAGKASAAMAQALEKHWSHPLTGLVVTRYGCAVPCERIEIVEAAHPVPDDASHAVAERMLAMVKTLTADDLVVALISGGGSSLLSLPAQGVTLFDKQNINRALLKSGATISEMNCVRRHLSAIKGGRLAAACHPARVLNLLISDVPGDDPADIASGPTVADDSTCQDALDIIRRYGIEISEQINQLLLSNALETIKTNDLRLPSIQTRMIATPQMAIEAAADVARAAGVTPLILGDSIEGEASEVAKVMSGIALQVRRHQQPIAPPCVLLSGGETTVTVRGNGCGGRNVEFLLSLAVALNGAPNIYAMAGDTDGVDGAVEVAGAFVHPDTLAKAANLGIRARDSLERNDGHGFFEAIGDQFITGSTLTNVNDFRAILIL